MLTDELKSTIQGAYRQLLDSKNLKPRLGQRLMMAEVARTLAGADVDANGHREGKASICVAEAGTGTGKTIAYGLKPFLSKKIKKIEVAVLVDRSHTAFPIKATYIGYGLSTTLSDNIQVTLKGKKGVYLN